MYHIFSYKDLLEIMFFSSCIYYFSVWLKQDRTKNLLFPFYCFCVVTLLASTFHLQTVSSFLLFYGPVIVLLFILVHQEQLQRNFVTLHNIKPQKDLATKNWVETVIQSTLRARTKNKTIRVIIEHTDSLSSCITAPFRLETEMQSSLLNMLLDSPSFDQEKMIWLSSAGKLIAINGSWSQNAQKEWIAQELKETDAWLTDTLLFTTKTDALAFSCTPETNGFTICAQGKVIEEVSAAQSLRIIGHFLKIPLGIKKGDEVYEINDAQKQFNKQSQP